jgi:hypothetical protein
LKHNESFWQGEHDGYKRLADPVNHKRTVMSLDEDRWLIVDHLTALKQHHYALHGLLNDFPFEQQENMLLLSVDSLKYKLQLGILERNGNFSIARADPNFTRGWRSQYYGDKEPALSVMLETHQHLTIFWSFFGLEEDVVQVEGNTLKINSAAINLADLTK